MLLQLASTQQEGGGFNGGGSKTANRGGPHTLSYSYQDNKRLATCQKVTAVCCWPPFYDYTTFGHKLYDIQIKLIFKEAKLLVLRKRWQQSLINLKIIMANANRFFALLIFSICKISKIIKNHTEIFFNGFKEKSILWAGKNKTQKKKKLQLKWWKGEYQRPRRRQQLSSQAKSSNITIIKRSESHQNISISFGVIWPRNELLLVVVGQNVRNY